MRIHVYTYAHRCIHESLLVSTLLIAVQSLTLEKSSVFNLYYFLINSILFSRGVNMEEKMRLQKAIAHKGICSRRKAEELITLGKVKVNGKIVNELGVQVSSFDTIEVEGYEDKSFEKEDKVAFLFNKPLRVVSTVSDDRGRETVVDYFKKEKYRL